MREVPMLRKPFFRSVFALLVLAALAVCALAQDPAPAPKVDRFILSAVDDVGAPVADLSAPDLDVRIGDRPARIAALNHVQSAPIRIVIVLDESSSMAV